MEKVAIMLIRSKLFVPGSRPELFDKAVASAADALSFDLEDAVAPERKADARAAVAAYLRRPRVPGKVYVVRVNAVGTGHFRSDMEAIVGPGLDVVNLPMVEDADAVSAAAHLLDEREPGGPRIRLLINIETPKSLRLAAALATAHPRVMGLQIGYADLFEPFGIDRRDPAALAHIRIAVRLAAAEAGIAVYDGAFANVADADGFRAECMAARAHGFTGKSCIHPSQIAIANAAFLPTAAEVEQARRIVSAAAEMAASGVGAFLIDGRMIDKPFMEGARRIVALADRATGEEEA